MEKKGWAKQLIVAVIIIVIVLLFARKFLNQKTTYWELLDEMGIKNDKIIYLDIDVESPLVHKRDYVRIKDPELINRLIYTDFPITKLAQEFRELPPNNKLTIKSNTKLEHINFDRYSLYIHGRKYDTDGWNPIFETIENADLEWETKEDMSIWGR